MVFLDVLWKLLQYVVNNPAKSLSLGLTSQNLGARTFISLQNTSSNQNATDDLVYLTHLNSSALQPEYLILSKTKTFNEIFGVRKSKTTLSRSRGEINSTNLSSFDDNSVRPEHLILPKPKAFYGDGEIRKSRVVRQSAFGPQKPDTREKLNELNRKLLLVQNQVNELKSKVNGNDHSTGNLNQLLRMKEDIAANIASLTTRVDDIKKSVSQEFLSEIDTIITKLQSLKSTMNKMTDAISELSKRVQLIDDALKNMSIEDCIAAIKEGHFDTAKTKWGRIQAYNNIDADIERIVRGAYSMSNFDKLDYFIRNVLPFIEQAAVAYTAVLQELRRDGQYFTTEVIQLGYRVKEYIQMPNYPKVPETRKRAFETLKAEIPFNVRDLLWGETFCLNNLRYTEYLHPADKPQHNAVTWGNLDSRCFRRNVWDVRAIEKTKYFYFKNMATNEYLCGSRENFDSDRGRVFTQAGFDDACVWKIEPGNEYSFKIKNKKYGSYLFAHAGGGGDPVSTTRGKEKSRLVLAWRSSGMPLDAWWSFRDCPYRREETCKDTYKLEEEEKYEPLSWLDDDY